jgi:crotonobetainyl-CoA:carnitine CoA-transferase CaiB-like acyl-CoA transferase
MKGILSPYTIVDLSRFLPGPLCSMILADHGARVIAVEDRRFEKENLPYLQNILRNKEHMTLNLKSASGKDAFFKLIQRADVVLEGFRPGVMDRLGVGYNQLRNHKPDIIYCAVSGYGQTGSMKYKAGHDVNFISESGVLSLIGPKNKGPVIPGIQLADVIGGLNAAIGILLGLIARGKTGCGQYLDISMTDGLMGILPLVAGWFWKYGQVPERGNFMFSHRYAFYNVYETADNRYISVGALERRFWETLCRYFNAPDFITCQFDETRQTEMVDFFQNAFSKKTRDEWVRIFADQDVCVSGVMDLDEALNGSLAQERNMLLNKAGDTILTEPVLGVPIKISGHDTPVRKAPPDFGQDTQRILAELGYSSDDISRMAVDGDI